MLFEIIKIIVAIAGTLFLIGIGIRGIYEELFEPPKLRDIYENGEHLKGMIIDYQIPTNKYGATLEKTSPTVLFLYNGETKKLVSRSVIPQKKHKIGTQVDLIYYDKYPGKVIVKGIPLQDKPCYLRLTLWSVCILSMLYMVIRIFIEVS